MLSSGTFVIDQIDVGAVGALTESILVLLTMVGRPPNPATSLGFNVGLLDPKLFIHSALLAGWFLSGFGHAYLLFDASVSIRVRIGVGLGGVLRLLHDSLKVTLLKSL